MALSIEFTRCTDDKRKLVKNVEFSAANTIEGVFKDEPSVVNPVVLIKSTINPRTFNYAKIAEFGRYYFIDGVRAVRNGLWEITLVCDVRMSYATSIKSCKTIGERSTSKGNSFLHDELFTFSTKPKHEYRTLGSFSWNGNAAGNFILVTAG